MPPRPALVRLGRATRRSTQISRSPVRSHTGASFGVAGLIVIFVMALPVLFVLTIYSFVTIYAIAKAFESAQDANPFTVFLGVVGIVTLYALLIGVAITLIGRSFDPRKGRQTWIGRLIRRRPKKEEPPSIPDMPASAAATPAPPQD
jgi:NADH:ubiquinone oxidoreductase subunit 6 (subunit J)